MNFNKKLLKERKRLRLTQAEMASSGCVGFSTYRAYERGENLPQVDTLIKWSESGVDVHYLLFGEAGLDENLDEKKMLDLFRQSSPETRRMLIYFLEFIKSNERRHRIHEHYLNKNEGKNNEESNHNKNKKNTKKIHLSKKST